MIQAAGNPLSQLSQLIGNQRKLLIVTGAGCSTGSGIPAYRDRQGNWRSRAPITHQEFVSSAETRKRYWSRSMIGWPVMDRASVNDTHRVLAKWEQSGRVQLLITQNVDGLHRQAGSKKLVELHGRVDRVVCLECGTYLSRSWLQQQLEAANPDLYAALTRIAAEPRPDGDAEYAGVDYHQLRLVACPHCGGVLMPDVVFFGGNVPKARVEQCLQAVDDCDAVLVLGSSLMVYSGFRFVRAAAQQGKPIVIVNQGVTRADDLAAIKIELDCAEVLLELDRKTERF